MEIKELLKQVRAGEIELERAEELLKSFPYEDLGYAKLDHHRGLRTGFRETIVCEGKPDEYLVQIYKKFYDRDGEVFGTRASEKQYQLVKEAVLEVTFDSVDRKSVV